ncbi:MAG TPA: amino acid adenylation domain-containing protein [Methylocella sp.]|nr:amino acid adenylation domain-containing protein [Methylocella sp.]
MNHKAAREPFCQGLERGHQNIIALLRARACGEEAGKFAFVFLGNGENETARLTFAELDRSARAVAVHLLELAKPGERALLLYPPGLEFIAAFLGCLYAGVIAVPANPPSRQHLHRLTAIVGDAAPSAVLTATGLPEEFEKLSVQTSQSAIMACLATSGIDLAAAERWKAPPVAPESTAFLQYTSGSTGTPKGVMISHGNLIANEAAIQAAFGHSSDSTVAGWLPLYHDMGLIGNVLQPLYVGATAYLMPPLAFLEKPVRWLKAITKYKARTSGGPNFAYELCVRQVSRAEKRELDLSSWILAFNGSETVRASTLSRFAEAFADCGFGREAFYPCYGLAEATLFVSGPSRGCGPFIGHFDKAALSRGAVAAVDAPSEKSSTLAGCGHCWSGHQVRIVDPETFRPCAEGEVGEIWFAGPSVSLGYWRKPSPTAQIIPDGAGAEDHLTYLRTGDLGFMHQGELFIAGRIKDLIIIRGANYHAADFERVLDERVPGLRPGCNAAFAADRGNEEVLVIVAEVQRDHFRKHGAEPVFQAIREAVSQEFSVSIGEMVLVPPGAVPKTTSGKIRRQACREAYIEGRLKALARSGIEPELSSGKDPGALHRDGGHAVAAMQGEGAENRIERLLTVEIARILRCPESSVAADKTLAELGLDSLQIVALKHALDVRLAIDLPLAALLEEKCLRALAEVISLQPAAAKFPPSIGDAAGLSETQRAIWTVHRLDDGGISYNLHLALQISGVLDPVRLRQAFALVLEQHHQLRTVYRPDGDGAVQSVKPLGELPEWFSVIDARSYDAAALQADMGARTRQPFDLERGPLLRVTLYLGLPGQSTLLLCAHHIAVDSWSLLLFIGDLDRAYGCLEAGLPFEPAAAPAYADFVLWQQEYLRGELARIDWEYWRGELGRPLPILALPADFPRASVPDYRGASKLLRISHGLTASLKALASRERVSLFALLLAVYEVLLHRLTGQPEIVVGVPTSGRLQARLARLSGNCVNPVAITGALSPRLPFVEFLHDVGRKLREALVHQKFPFPLLVERLQPERQGNHWPVFQTTFVLQQAQSEFPPHMALLALGEDGEPFTWCGCEAKPLAAQERVENFDLKLMAAEGETGLFFSFQYRTDIFLTETVSRIADHYLRLLEGIVAAPDRCVGDLPLLNDAEQHRQLFGWNTTAAAYSSDSCLTELLAAQAARTPDAVAVSFDGLSLTYAELDEQSELLAAYLESRGVRPDTVVALCLERSLEMIIGILGIMKAGGAYLPLDPEYPKERLAFMVADAAPLLILTKEQNVPLIPEGTECFCIDKEWGKTADLSRKSASARILPGNLAYVIYTSGSTGRPKGVAVPHGGLINRLEWMRAYLGVSSSDVVLQKTPYGFDVSAWEFFLPFLAGARLVMAGPHDHADPARLAELMAQEGVTICHFVPSMLSAFLDHPGLPDFAALRHVVCSGEALSAGLRDRFLACQSAQLHNLYGPTEASIDVTAHTCARGSTDTNVPIGRPVWNTRIYILDAALNPAPVNVAGELYIGGTALARGYLGRPGLTAERFVPDPFAAEGWGLEGERLYRTGDLARWRADGTIEYLGRLDHQVKIRGFRIELGEIEARLCAHKDIRQAVVAVREAGAVKQLVAYVVRAGSSSCDAGALRAWLRCSLPDHMIPAAYMWLDALPLTPNGKIDRNALPVLEADSLAADYVALQTPEEELVADVWKEVLGAARVGATDNFFALGGDSILSIQASSRLRAAGFEVTPRQMFLHPTVRELAPRLRRIAGESNESHINSCQSFSLAELTTEEIDSLRARYDDLDDIYPLTPMQEGMLFHCLMQPGSGVYILQDQYEIRGHIDIEAFRSAWQKVVDRHNILRSAMVWRNIGKPHQLVLRNAKLPFYFEDQRGLTSEAQEQRRAGILEAERREGFDLEKPPLMAIRLFRLNDDLWRCIRSHHHILTDEWCTSILFVDFRDNYAALAGGRQPPVRSAYSFRNYLAWLKSRDPAVAEAFWRNCLKGFHEPTPLVISHARRKSSAAAAQVLDAEAHLGKEETLALQRVAQEYRVTPNTVVQAAWGVLLARYAGKPDVVFGITVSGRPAELPGIEETVGLFINTLPLRLKIRGSERISAWWQEIQALNLELRQHEYTPLVQCQAWSEVPGGAPLFQHLLVYENAPVDPSLLTDRSVLDMRFIRNRVHTNYPVTVTVIPREELKVRITYQADLFSEESVQRLLAHFLGLLRSMIAQPEDKLVGLSLLLPEERQQLMRWNATAHPYAPPADVISSFEMQVLLCPDAPAARCGQEILSYRELNIRANKLAHGLIARGVGPETVVAITGERSLTFLVMLLGVLKAGGVYLPIDPRHPRLRRLTIIKDSGAAAALADEAWLPELQTLCESTGTAAASPSEIEDAGGESNPPLRVKPQNLAYIIFTSGSTGTPKGAMVDRLGMFNNLMTKIPALDLGPGDIIAQTASQAFDISVWQFMTALLCGACIDILPDDVAQDPGSLLGALRDRGITVLESVPSVIRQLLDAAGEVPPLLRLRWLLPTGEALQPDLCRRWFAHYPKIPMLNAYGPAECADDVAYHRIDSAPSPDQLVTPIGRPVSNLQLYILDRSLDPLPVGVPGELCVAGMGVGRGYVKNPGLTASSFLPNPFGGQGERLYRTGDLARFQPDGTIEFLGRIDQQVKIRGHRVETGEIEAQLARHPTLKEAAVKVWEDEKTGQRLAGYFVLRPGETVRPEGLRRYLRNFLPDYMVPEIWMELEALPLNANGKLDRKSLPPPNQAFQQQGYEPPATPTEDILAGIWAGLLNCGRVGRHSNFFELGGHSLLATQAVARANSRFGLKLPLRAIFDAPTLAAFARQADAARRTASQACDLPVSRAPRDQALPLSHAQWRLWLMHQIDPANPLYHFPVAVRIRGPFDPSMFEASLNAIIQRHEALRTVFKGEEGAPRQEILSELTVKLRHEAADREAIDGGSGQDDLLRRMREAVAVPFDLSNGPLLRAIIYSPPSRDGGAQICAVLICFHHIIFDGWSFGVFLREFAALYASKGDAGGASSLPLLPVQYADYASWQHEQMRSSVISHQLDYWIGQLRDAPAVLDLAPHRARNAETGGAAANHALDLSPLQAALNDFGHEHAVTPFMTMLSAFAILLSYLSGARDIVVGADIANRQRSEFEPLIGFFINLVALRIRLNGNPRFADIIEQVREVTLAAYDNQDLPFDKLVEAIRPERSRAHSPLFQVKLVYHNVPLSELDLPGLKFEAIPFETGRTELDLVLHVYESGRGLRAVFEYRASLFDAPAIARFAGLFRLILERAISAPLITFQALIELLAEHDRAIRTAGRAEQRASRLSKLHAARRKGIELRQ